MLNKKKRHALNPILILLALTPPFGATTCPGALMQTRSGRVTEPPASMPASAPCQQPPRRQMPTAYLLWPLPTQLKSPQIRAGTPPSSCAPHACSCPAPCRQGRLPQTHAPASGFRLVVGRSSENEIRMKGGSKQFPGSYGAVVGPLQGGCSWATFPYEGAETEPPELQNPNQAAESPSAMKLWVTGTVPVPISYLISCCLHGH